MEETSGELPNFSIGPDPTSNNNKAEKNLQVDSLTFKAFFSSFGFDFLNSPRKFWAFHSQLSLKPKYKMWRVFDQPIETFAYFFLCVVRILQSTTIKGFFAQILVVALL